MDSAAYQNDEFLSQDIEDSSKKTKIIIGVSISVIIVILILILVFVNSSKTDDVEIYPTGVIDNQNKTQPVVFQEPTQPVVFQEPTQPVVFQESPVNQIILFTEKDFKGVSQVLKLNDGKFLIADYLNNKFNFKWRSMKVTKGTKLVFSRNRGNSDRRTFAFGYSDVNDLESWIMKFKHISGQVSYGFGTLNLSKIFGDNKVYLSIVNDQEWSRLIDLEREECKSQVRRWGGESKGIPESNCNTINETLHKGIRTSKI